MNYFLFPLRFDTPVHFGSSDSALSLYTSEEHFRADTLFSALCHTALQLGGREYLEKLLALVKSGALLLSDAMPHRQDCLYLPKPVCPARSNRELPADRRKALKKLAWIPLDRFGEYCTCLRTGELFSCEAAAFGIHYETTRACTPDAGDALPYPVGLWRFCEDCGLSFLAGLENPAQLEFLSELVRALGVSGIGGKTSSGCGKFALLPVQDLSCTQDPALQKLNAALHNGEGTQMLLTTGLPREEELESALEGATFQLVRRAGFIARDTHSETPRKKQTQYFLSAGSLVPSRFSGDIYEAAAGGTHPVLRYSLPVFMGVQL